MVRLYLIASALALTLIACGKPGPVDDKAGMAAAALPQVSAPAPSAAGEPRSATAPAQPLPAPAATVPAALQGRWGLSPSDCMTTHGDAKGLLVVSPGELRFYESRAVPVGDVETDSSSIAGSFAFAGDGRSWIKYESVRLDKQMLVRTETKPSVSFTYAKCS